MQEENRKLGGRVLRTAVLLLLLAGLLVLLALLKVSNTVLRIGLLVLAAIPLIGSLLCFYVLWLANSAKQTQRNFFLYDPKRKCNRSVEELDADEVMGRTLQYMSMFRRGRQLYIASLFDEAGGAPEVFKPLFCYQLFALLILCDERERWDAFLACGKELADTFDRYLTEQEDEELCRRLQTAVACYPEEGFEAFREYLLPKRALFSERIMNYVRQHIREFG